MTGRGQFGPDWNRRTSLLVIGGFAILAVLAVILALTPPARGYEFSIYGAYPLAFWILTGLGLFVGQALILRQVFGGEGRTWQYGLLLIVSIEVLIVLLPYFRGYPVFNRSDVLTHLGYIKSIHETHAIGETNIYPNIHLLVLTLSYATGVDPIHIINAIPAVVTAFWVATIYVFVRTVFDRRRGLATLPFATIFLGGAAHSNPSPYAQTFFVVPFVLYLFVRGQRSQGLPTRIALAVVLVSLVVYHPLTTLFLLFIFGIYSVVWAFKQHGVLPSKRRETEQTTVAMAVSHLLIAVFLAWYSNFTSIVQRFETAYERLFVDSDGGQSTLATYGSTIAETTPSLIDLGTIAVVKKGQAMLLLTLGGIYVVKTGIEWLFGRTKAGLYELTFAGSFVLFSGLAVVFLVVDLFVGFGRLLLYARLFGALLAGLVCYDLYTRYGSRRLLVGAVYVSCALLVVVSVVSVYHSPLEKRRNQQVTESELQGSEWLLENRAVYVKIEERGINMWRFRDLHYGERGYDTARIVLTDGNNPPPHFGYTSNATYGETYESDHYFVLTEVGRSYYQNIFPGYRKFWEFTPADFARLERDSTVAHIYDNGEFDVYYVNGTG